MNSFLQWENEREFVHKIYAFPKASGKKNNNKFFGLRISLEKRRLHLSEEYIGKEKAQKLLYS